MAPKRSKISISHVQLDTESKDDVSSSKSSEDEHQEDDQIGKGVGTAQVTINREEYLQAYRDITNETKHLQIKNNILHRRLAEFYKKRKCEHVLKPFEGAADLEEKYQQKLIAYEDIKERSERETTELWAKVSEVDGLFMGQNESAENKFKELQTYERSTGTGLIYSAKGKPIADKTVERLLTLQKSKWEQASALCLRYIRARNAVAELEAIVKRLEIIGPGLYVYQYEQLVVENQNYTGKLEEREDELIKNRTKCTEHNQILAHIREKMHHTDEVIDMTECNLGESELEHLRAREDLGYVKTRRNKLRFALEDERLKAGLLTRKDLLRDFQDAIDKVEVLRKVKEKLESQIATTVKKLREARKTVNSTLKEDEIA